MTFLAQQLKLYNKKILSCLFGITNYKNKQNCRFTTGQSLPVYTST